MFQRKVQLISDTCSYIITSRDIHDEACSVDVVLFYFLFSVVVGRNLSMKVILTCDEEFYTPKPNKSNKPNYHLFQLGFSPRLRMRIKTNGWTPKKARNPRMRPQGIRMRPLYFIYPPSLGPSMKLWSNYFRDSRAFREILNPKLSSEKFDWLFEGLWLQYELVWNKNHQNRNLFMDLKQVAWVRLSDFLAAHGFRDVHQPRSLGSCLQFRMHKVSGPRIFWTEESPWVR